MKKQTIRFFKKKQADFRYRLFLLRKQQLTVAKERSEKAKYEWQAYLAHHKIWKQKCDSILCDGCGYKKNKCLCNSKISCEELVRMLRRIAKINPGHPLTPELYTGKRRDKFDSSPGDENNIRILEGD